MKPYAEILPTSKLNWGPMLFVLLSPLAAAALAWIYVSRAGFLWTDLVPFFALYALTGLSITVGYHRYFSHRSFECHPAIRALLLVFGAASVQNSLLTWASNHRYHHQYTDREGDPYNINRGFMWAHMGWIFFREPKERPFRNVNDLKKDPWVMWQHRNYPLLAIVAGFLFPTLIGAAFGRPLAGLIWGGLVRMVITHHVTFMVNSVAHTVGKKTYSATATARDSSLLALVTFGEGYHSFHHRFPADYRNGIAWYHFDPGKWVIDALAGLGLAGSLRITRTELLRPEETQAV